MRKSNNALQRHFKIITVYIDPKDIIGAGKCFTRYAGIVCRRVLFDKDEVDSTLLINNKE